uniref:Metabolism of cobalamin associated B n=1 Tax=Oncorhynchus mykiss TaxID=8022 RepID=A0A8C7NPB5_ONCMY
MITKTSHLRCILTIVTCLTLDSSIPKIYTKTGNKGGYSSNTYTGKRRPKEDHVFEALGTTDELIHGLVFCINKGHTSQIMITCLNLQIQCVLQDVGSNITTLLSSRKASSVPSQWQTWKAVSTHSEELPPLTNFILPLRKSSAALHIARTVCRRAEYSVSLIVQSGEADPDVATFLNRLSNYLFPVEKIYKRPE